MSADHHLARVQAATAVAVQDGATHVDVLAAVVAGLRGTSVQLERDDAEELVGLVREQEARWSRPGHRPRPPGGV